MSTITGYLCRAADGTMRLSANAGNPVPAGRVWVGDRSCLVGSDGAYILHVEPGTHELRAWAVFGGRVHHIIVGGD